MVNRNRLIGILIVILFLGFMFGVTGVAQQDDFLYRLKPELRGHVPMEVRRMARNWTQDQKNAFVNRFRSQAKETMIAYITFFALGGHYAYLGDWGKQALYWVTLGGFGIWALVDLFNMESLVKNKNRDIALRIAQEIERGLGY